MQFLYFVKSACKFNKFIAAKNIKTYIFIPFYKALLQVLTTPMRIGNRNESFFFLFLFRTLEYFATKVQVGEMQTLLRHGVHMKTLSNLNC